MMTKNDDSQLILVTKENRAFNYLVADALAVSHITVARC
jgi:hypothetical protein